MQINNEISPGMGGASERSTAASIITLFDNPNPGNFVMRSKKCKGCGENKQITEYFKSKNHKDGHFGKCKNCCSVQSVSKRRTKEGLIKAIYYDQIKGSKVYKDKPVLYSYSELKEWCLSQSLFHKLYDNWVDSGYSKELRPSVDRKDDYKGYSFNNIQLMTWRENREKSYRDVANHINKKKFKPILKSDTDGNIIEEYDSVKKAAEGNNVSVASIILRCQGKRTQPNNIVFKYKN